MKYLISIMIGLWIPSIGVAQETSILDREVIIRLETSDKEALQQLGKQWGHSISYNSDLLKGESVRFNNDTLSVRDALRRIFQNDHVKFRQIGNQVVAYFSDLSLLPTDSCYQLVQGQVLDELTGQPIAKATVRSLNTDLMTVTNEDGKFILSIPCASPATEVSIVAPGYQSRLMRDLQTDQLGALTMRGSYITLQEVMILSVPVEKIVQEVLARVNENYLSQPTNSRAFFREAILRNGKLGALSEAVFYAYNRSYSLPKHGDQVQLIKGRKFTDLDTVTFKVKGSVKSCFDLDVIKNPPGFLQPDETGNYRYALTDIVEYDGSTAYVIDFDKLPGTPGLPYKGRMHINKENYGLHSIAFELDRDRLSDEELFVVKSTRGAKTKFMGSSYFVSYTELDDRLVMNYASIKTSFKVKMDKRLFYSSYETISEYVVNQFEIENVEKIRSKDTFIAGRVIMDEPLNYDPEYWHGINYLPIDKPLNRASAKLKRIIDQ